MCSAHNFLFYFGKGAEPQNAVFQTPFELQGGRRSGGEEI